MTAIENGTSPPLRRRFPHRLLDITFRAKLLLALVGTVGLLGAASLVVVRIQTERQIDWMIQRTGERAQHALVELERFRRAELERLAKRITGSIRIVAALEATLDDGDPSSFADDVRYELALAEFERGLVAFHDDRGRPILTMVDGRTTVDAETQDALVAEVTAKGTATGTYRLVNGTLFAVQAHRLELFGAPIGAVTLGFPLESDAAVRLGEIVGADVCFATEDRCVVGTPATQSGELGARMVQAARAGEPVLANSEGRRLALVATKLPGTTRVTGVVAVPLDDVLTPFDRIYLVERIAAASALALAILLGLVLSKELTTPIRTLVGATERVRRGEFDFSVRVPHRDELGQLADAFNQMTQGLLLKERYRGVLDKVVSPRVAAELMKGEIRLGGETVEVSTLFADIRGFTSQTEFMTPEDVVRMLNEWLELAAGSIEEDGGVVDKYVGDQVMAIFGAPIAQEDHAVRAVRAGLRLRAVTEELNRARQARGQHTFTIGIGIYTGPAVAGNVGSARRLNYTVLGASVNAASRLCGEAAAGELLVAETTYAAVAHLVDATRAAPRISKGFSHAITPYSIHGFRQAGGEIPAAARGSGIVSAALAVLLASAIPAQAQVLDVPTFDELGWRFVSSGGLIQIQPSLKVDVDAFFPQDVPAWHLEDTGAFLAGSGRLFIDVFAGQRVFATTELRVDRGQPARAGPLRGHLQQAFVRVRLSRTVNVNVQAGKFISPIGEYPQRAHTTADPLVRPPLLYDHRTVMQAARVPAMGDGVFTWKNNPEFRLTGLPIVWDAPYPIGVIASAGTARWTLGGGVVTTAPSAEPEDWDRLRQQAPAGPSVVGHASYQIVPEVRIGASYSHGSYLGPRVDGGPDVVGRQLQDFRGLHAIINRGGLDVRIELVSNAWEVFRVKDPPRDVSYSIEARQTLSAGLFVAARYGAIHFRDLERASGVVDRWDYDRRRLQLGAGYRLGRGMGIRGEYMFNWTVEATDPADNLLSIKWWLAL
jgi:class 3 adenylate cyclase